MDDYVHGYTDRERERLHDQANTLADLLHHDTRYPAGTRVLEVGCGVGAQLGFLTANSPAARFTSMDRSAPSLAKARQRVGRERLAGVRLCRGDLFRMPFAPATFDHAFVCFVLEHLTDPLGALRAVRGVLKPGGTLTVIEGDHGSCTFHPETEAARRAWNCLIRVQAGLGADSTIGRRLYPLLRASGVEGIRVTRRDVYCDESRPQWMDGFVKKTIIPMVEGVREQALAQGMIDEATWAQGIRDLHATGTPPEGVFCYTFFKGVAVKPD